MTARRRRVLITDAVPMNGGDELLLRSLLRGLTTRWPDSDLTVMTHAVEASRALLGDVRIVGDLRTAPAAAAAAYAEADLVISTPGGFLNRHYDFAHRLEGFQAAHRAGRPLVLFGQSIGPFADEAQCAAVGAALRGAALIAVRDALSRQHLARCGVDGPQVVEVPDLAFLWPAVAATAGDPARRVSRVGLCLRKWPRDDTHRFRTAVRTMRVIIARLARRGVEQFVFASTCQGLPGYVDDAVLSHRVVAGLRPALAARVVVHDARLSPADYIAVMGQCDLFIGMRLHGCLMAMLAGTPAFGLAYEDKTPQIFDQLGIGAWQLPYSRPLEAWWSRIHAMLPALPQLRAELPARLAVQSARAGRALDRLDPFLR